MNIQFIRFFFNFIQPHISLKQKRSETYIQPVKGTEGNLKLCPLYSFKLKALFIKRRKLNYPLKAVFCYIQVPFKVC